MPVPPPDIFPLGIFLELLASLLSGGKPKAADEEEYKDVLSHVEAAKHHEAAALKARDPYNQFIGFLDRDTNKALGWTVASRIGDRELRAKAFQALGTIGFGPLQV